MSESTKSWLGEVTNVAVLGAGTMGHGIAQVFALGGYDVMLYDIGDDILQKALVLIDSHLDTFVKNGLTTEEARRQALARIKTTTDLSRVKDASFVAEAAPERIELKQKVHRDVEEICHPDTIVASNTSSLRLGDISSLCKCPENHVVAHWFNPPYIVPLVEVVKGTKTSMETMDRTYAFLERVGKKPAKIMKEAPGFVANRMQMALAREAFSILEKGIASAEDIDTVVKASFGFRLPTIGVFETCDLAGLDVYLAVIEQIFPEIESSTEPPRLLKEAVAQKKFGAKAGEGIYKWPKEKLEVTIKERDTQFLRRLKQLYLRKE